VIDVLVVGAGVIGASVAWHLAVRGCRNVRVIDRAPEPGGGSTSRATGGFRAQFGSDVNVRLSLLSRDKLRRFREEVGVDPGYRPTGYLFIARREEDFARLRAAQAVQHAAGLTEARMVAEGAFCPTDGFIAPMEILTGYIDAAKAMGVRFDFGVEYTPDMRAGTIVNAAGAWAAQIAEVPVRPVCRQILPTVGTGTLDRDGPMTIWLEDWFHFRVRDGRALLLWPGGEERSETTVDAAWLDRVESIARERVPELAGVPVDRAGAWAGLYEMSPDSHAIVGRVGDWVYANGSSGHGVMHAPAIGQIVSEIIVDGVNRWPELRPSRFAEGQPIRGVELL
jgi:sarcosine oxidase, subunit beta